MVCFDKTFEAAEALLHMESPGGLHNERSTGKYTVCASPLRHSLIDEWSVNGKLVQPLVLTPGNIK